MAKMKGGSEALGDRIWCWSLMPKHDFIDFHSSNIFFLEPPMLHGNKHGFLTCFFYKKNQVLHGFPSKISRKSRGPGCPARSWSEDCKISPMQLGGKRGWVLFVCCFVTIGGWWFQTCFIFHFIYGIILPIDFQIFQDDYGTTNQIGMYYCVDYPDISDCMVLSSSVLAAA